MNEEIRISSGIVEVDLHGKSAEEARKILDRRIETAGRQVYRIRAIHGFHGGTGIKRMIWEEYSYGRSPKVLRLAHGANEGITELILREF